jgi:two-component system sensor histidine kinase QseC
MSQTEGTMSEGNASTQSPSLKMRLLRNLMISLFLVWLVVLGLAYFFSSRSLNDQQDVRLADVASSIFHAAEKEPEGDGDSTLIVIRNAETLIQRESKNVEFQVLRDDKLVIVSSHAPKESFASNEGYSETRVEDKEWRVFTLHRGASRITVGEDLRLRAELIRATVLSNVWPMLLAFPFIAFVIWVSVLWGLRPLDELARAISERKPDQLNPIDLVDVPSEVFPVIQSLNELFSVVRSAFERERQFTDNAAHELRTPLAAIKTQAQVAMRSSNDIERHESLSSVNRAIDRASKIVMQLLTLARLQPGHDPIALTQVNLHALVVATVAKFVPQALARNIEIGVGPAPDITLVLGDEGYLEILTSNLLDNAIRYAAADTVIEVSVLNRAGRVELEIENAGPGIPEAERTRVFQRFVRLASNRNVERREDETMQGEGSGIGLAIVHRIAELHFAEVKLRDPDQYTGLVVTVSFPKAACGA